MGFWGYFLICCPIVAVWYGIAYGLSTGRIKNHYHEHTKKIWNYWFHIVFACLFGVMGYRLTANDKTAVFVLLFAVGFGIAFGVYGLAKVFVGKEIVMHIVLMILCIIMGIAVFSIPNHHPRNSSSGGGDSSYSPPANHECYVCGDSGNIKYGSHYYCPTHYAYVKTVVDNS